jgi:hypothetical protein
MGGALARGLLRRVTPPPGRDRLPDALTLRRVRDGVSIGHGAFLLQWRNGRLDYAQFYAALRLRTVTFSLLNLLEHNEIRNLDLACHRHALVADEQFGRVTRYGW